MYKHILLATDLADESEYILKKVRKIRGYTGARLSLVHVVEPMPGYSYAYLGIEDIEGQLIEESRIALAKIGQTLEVDKKDQWIEVGPTKSKIHAVASQIGADPAAQNGHRERTVSLRSAGGRSCAYRSASVRRVSQVS